MITLSIPSSSKELDKVLEFVNLGQELAKGSIEFWMKLLDTVQKIFINIVTNAYHTIDGIVKISFNYIEEQQVIEILFIHEGIPYNPLEGMGLISDDIDEYKAKGSFGVLLLEKSTEKISYRYQNKKNVTTVRKYLELAY